MIKKVLKTTFRIFKPQNILLVQKKQISITTFTRNFENKTITPTHLPRTNIGIFGPMNSGKSTLMNMITKSNVSIVDSTPGTTADVKTTFMQIHDIGPCKIRDTPGFDETGLLGEKKKEKTIQTMKESDICILVINPLDLENFESTKNFVELMKEKKKNIIVVFNIHQNYLTSNTPEKLREKIDEFEIKIGLDKIDASKVKEIDLTSESSHKLMINFIEQSFKKTSPIVDIELLPPFPEDSIVFMNIPMDGQTPTGRLLKPQAMVQEYLIRNKISSFCYRMDLTKGRSNDEVVSLKEKKRFLDSIGLLNSTEKLKLVITDSQAIDLVHHWLPKDVLLTTFSVTMINYMSGGKLKKFAEGIKAFSQLKKGDHVLICEACNHNRIIDDIGTVQIPNKIRQIHGDDIGIDHSFGREYQYKDFSKYKLIIHCGGCMLENQQMMARLADFDLYEIPITNYGLLLSYFSDKSALQQVLKPFGVEFDF
jgi:[FeFe] hydrogenase H-cluster maturation GTPase HydF